MDTSTEPAPDAHSAASASWTATLGLGACVSLCVLALYVWTSAPGPYWLDSSELASAAWLLGTPHPPGHPLYTTTANPLSLVPLGSLGWRMNLASAVSTALACGVLSGAALRLLRGMGVGPRMAVALAASGGALAGSTWALWFQAVRAEVYGLHLLVAASMVALTLALERAAARAPAPEDADAGDAPVDPRPLYGLALVSGLGLANHHYLTVFAGVVCAAVIALRKPLRRLLLSWHGLRAVGFGVMGVMTYAMVPLRSWRNPYVNWGSVASVDELVWLVTAKAFQKSLDRASDVDPVVLVLDLFVQLGRWLTPLGLVFAVVALVMLVRWKPWRGVALTLAAFVGMNLLTQSLMNFDPNNPDVHGYFALSAWTLALVLTLGAGRLERLGAETAHNADTEANRAAGRWVARAAAPMLALLTAVNLAMTLPQARLDTFRDVDITNAALLRHVPQNALVLTSNYKTLFNLWYAQGIEQRRPDVTHVHRNFFANAPYIRELEQRHPDLLKLVAKPGASNQLNLAVLSPHAASRPVFIEYDINIHPALEAHLMPEGLLFRVSPRPIPPGPLPDAIVKRQIDAWEGYTSWIIQRNAAGALDLETQRHLVWQHYLAALQLVPQQRVRLARYHLDRALALNPGSPELMELAQKLQAARPSAAPQPPAP